MDNCYGRPGLLEIMGVHKQSAFKTDVPRNTGSD